MRNSVLKRALPLGALAAVVAALVWSLLPASEPSYREAAPATPREPPPHPTAATTPAPAPSQSAPPSEPQPTPEPLTAEQLTERAKQQLALDPAAALEDIARADQLAESANDADNETRRVIEIHALVRLGKVGLARTLTDRFYRAFPNSERAAELERLTGYHPRPTGP